jgi:hypothetical protein
MATTDTTPVNDIIAETMRVVSETPAPSKELTKTLTTTAVTATVVLAGFYANSKLAPKVKDLIARHRSAEVVVEEPVEPATPVRPAKKA